MSVLQKIKDITENVEKLAKESPVVTITGDCHMLIENYNSLKLFSDDKLLIELSCFDLYIAGTGLAIDFFSPSRIMVCGKIKNISYLSDDASETEEL